MCGRYLLDADYEALIERYKIFDDFSMIYEKKSEVFPGQSIVSVINNGEHNEMCLLTWGLKIMPKRQLINSRVETVQNSKFYSRLKPCIIPASGYYEWEPVHKSKCKITANESLLSLAGLYDRATRTVSIVTTQAVPDIEGIHDRMPLMIEESRQDQWLKTLEIKAFLKHYKIEKTLNFSVENLEPNLQLSFLDDDLFHLK